MKKLRILIADDHGLVRHGARAVLNSQRGWLVVGEAANGPEAVQKAIQLKPDVAVVDTVSWSDIVISPKVRRTFFSDGISLDSGTSRMMVVISVAVITSLLWV